MEIIFANSLTELFHPLQKIISSVRILLPILSKLPREKNFSLLNFWGKNFFRARFGWKKFFLGRALAAKIFFLGRALAGKIFLGGAYQ